MSPKTLIRRARVQAKRVRDCARYAKDRRAIHKLLGGACPCGFKDPRALQIDHRHGGGTAHRKLGGSWPALHRDVRRHPSKYRLLCANCNCIARIENGQHRKPREK